jgi:general secretion pathway protein J
MSPSNFGVRPQTRQLRGLTPGFTLVELLVALAIFALMSAFAYRGLNAMLESREALQKESRKWRDVSLFVGRIERDIAAALPRRAVSAQGVPLAPITSSLDTGAAPQGIALTRSGSPLMENTLSAPQRVAWRLGAGGRVERVTWAGVDMAPREEPTATAILASVSALDFRFLDPKSLEWRTAWSPPGTDDGFPAAVEMTLTLASGERIVRLFDLPRLG